MIVALIPAKGNSSRLKNKNNLYIGKNTLLEKAILDCKDSRLIDECFVSSENKKIRHTAKKNGIKTVNRPIKLSQKKTPMNDVIKHFINHLKKNKIIIKTIVLIQPTSPFRPKKIIDKLLKNYEKSNVKSLITVKKSNNSFFKSIVKINSKFIVKYPNFFFSNTQELPKIYIPNGMIYIFDVKEFLKKNKISLENTKFLDVNFKNDIDIDTKEDYLKAQKIYEKQF